MNNLKTCFIKDIIQEHELDIIIEKLQEIDRIHTNNKERLKLFLIAVFYMLRSGCQWRALPPAYGRWRGVHMRFKNWCDKGIWNKLFYSMHHNTTGDDFDKIILDSTIVRSHSCSAGLKKTLQKH